MIRVNLLPEEYRKVESTSLSLFLLFLIGIVLVALAFVAWLTLNLQGGTIASNLKEAQARRKKITDEAKQVDKLEGDLIQYSKRLKTIMAIRAGRIYWSKKLDLLVADTPEDIWFVSIRMVQNEPIRTAPGQPIPPNADGGYLEFQCYQRTDNIQILARYRDDLMSDRVLYADFSRMKPPDLAVVAWPDTHPEDQMTLSYKIVLYLKPQVIYIE